MSKNKEWVCLVHGYKALPVCGLCISKPDPEREAIEDVIYAAKDYCNPKSVSPVLNQLRLALDALDRVRDRERGK